jgi:hypothetical protein
MREQKMTISGLYRPGWHAFHDLGQVPLLQLAGQWLAEAGFPVGTKVRVEVVEDGRVLVSRVDAWEEELQAQTLAPVEEDEDERARERREEPVHASA